MDEKGNAEHCEKFEIAIVQLQKFNGATCVQTNKPT